MLQLLLPQTAYLLPGIIENGNDITQVYNTRLVLEDSTKWLWCSTLLGPMEFSIKFHTVRSGWSIVHIEGHRL